MSQHMEVTVKGHLGNDPEKVATTGGTPLTVLRMAHSSVRKAADGKFESEAQWFNVKCFGDLALNAADCLTKGNPILVRGRIVTENFTTREGEARSRVSIIAAEIGVELSGGTAHFTRVRRGESEPAQPARPVPYPASADIPPSGEALRPVG